MESVIEFARNGGPVMGICNGFQILCEAGLLPGALLRNNSVRFQSHDVLVRVEDSDTMFTSNLSEGDVLRIPIAHAEGKYHADPDTLADIEARGMVVFRYTDKDGVVTDAANPNGSANNIAGIVNTQGNVLGMMPHPERAIESLLGSTDGLGIFTSLLAHLSPAGAPASLSST
jgi:phosphoribosylformylglycinamidine synthase